jgi:hypothetical protein
MFKVKEGLWEDVLDKTSWSSCGTSTKCYYCPRRTETHNPVYTGRKKGVVWFHTCVSCVSKIPRILTPIEEADLYLKGGKNKK